MKKINLLLMLLFGCSSSSEWIVLFDGMKVNGLKGYNQTGFPTKDWTIVDGNLKTIPGHGVDLISEDVYKDFELELEWRVTVSGNSGIFFQKRYELQVLDSFNNRTYSNGQAASIYKQHIPLVNASKKPGEWQSYDVIFEAPVFNSDKTLQQPAFITVFHNGVLVHNHVKLDGPTLYSGVPQYTAHPKKQPLLLQDHQEPVSYRNIWIRNLPID